MTESTAQEFWVDRCTACAHFKHPLAVCYEIVDGTFEPYYCECSDQIRAMEQEIGRLRRVLAQVQELVTK